MYKEGDFVVDSVNGICRIDDTVHLDFVPDKKQLYFLLTPVKETKSEVFIPVDKADDRFRQLLTVEQIDDLMNDIIKIDSLLVNNDKEREHIYREALNSRDPKKLVSLIKTLYFRCEMRHKEGKKSTVVDEKYYRLAENSLYSEIGFVLHLDNNEVKQLIKEKVD